MNREDRQIRDLLLKADTLSSEHESQLHSHIMRQLPTRSLRRIYLIVFFAILWGGGIALFVKYWRIIADTLLTTIGALLDHTLPSVETLGIAALCIGAIILVVTQSRDILDEYYEHELKSMLDGL